MEKFEIGDEVRIVLTNGDVYEIEGTDDLVTEGSEWKVWDVISNDYGYVTRYNLTNVSGDDVYLVSEDDLELA